MRTGICSAAAGLFSEAVWPTGHAAAAAHGTTAAVEIGSAVLLSLLFVCVWDPLKERIARAMLRAPHEQGELIGLPALVLVVVLGTGLVWIHTVLHHYIQSDVGEAFGAALERGLIVLIVCGFWFSARQSVWLRAGLAVALVGVIALVGQVLVATGLTQVGWTSSEIVWSIVPCLLLLSAERYFRHWQPRSAVQAATAVLTVGAAVIGLTGVVHLIGQYVPLPAVLMYHSIVGGPRDWAGTMLDDLFFYGGWAGGLWITPDVSGHG